MPDAPIRPEVRATLARELEPILVRGSIEAHLARRSGPNVGGTLCGKPAEEAWAAHEGARRCAGCEDVAYDVAVKLSVLHDERERFPVETGQMLEDGRATEELLDDDRPDPTLN